MPPRRKSSTIKAAPARPRTRSQKVALEVPASPLPAPTKRRGRPPGIRATDVEVPPPAEIKTRAPRRIRNKVVLEPPLPEVVSEDELNISPSKLARSTRNAVGLHSDFNDEDEGDGSEKPKPRMFMDSVEIATPSKLSSEGAKRGRKNTELRKPLVVNSEVEVVLAAASPAIRGRKKVELGESMPDDSGATMLPTPVTPAQKNKTRTVEDIALPTTPVKRHSPSPARPPLAKRAKLSHLNVSPSKSPRGVLPVEFHACLNAQKRAVLAMLQRPPLQFSQIEEEHDDEEPMANEVALQQLDDLLRGTVERGEGNSCLLIGPRSSGKTRIVETVLESQSQQPIVIRLSGNVQTTDRLAMREIARQAAVQTGSSFLADSDVSDPTDEDTEVNLSLPPSSHLPALISVLPTLKRPTIIILDAFDLFALHPRQALLYCLLDTAQSCRVGDGMNGIAVIGVTTRVDTINLLEKRVKSRFSGRILRTASPRRLSEWIAMARTILTMPVSDGDTNVEWSEMWSDAVEQFLAERATENLLNDTFALTRDVAMLNRIMMSTILSLTPSKPFPTLAQLKSATLEQRCPPRLPFLQSLSYPCMCLLIAAVHTRTSGHDVFTFEMLHEMFREQVRTSSAAPVQMQGGSVGMMKCSREILMAAFEYMIKIRGFVVSGPTSANIAKEFGKYRCMADRDDVKKVIEKQGGTNLKKWFSKAK